MADQELIRADHLFHFTMWLNEILKTKGAKFRALGPINPPEWKPTDPQVIEIEYEGQHYFLTVAELKGDELKIHQKFLEEYKAA